MECVACHKPLISDAAYCSACGARQPFAPDYEQDLQYAAFISYRHVPRDQQIARDLQKAIETFRIPKGVAERSPYVEQNRRLGRVFQDETELAASPSLPDSIRDALAHSAALIVVCSPDTAHSRWVAQEIELFASQHGRDRIFCVLAEGASNEVVPFALQKRISISSDGSISVEHTSPLAVDLRQGADAKSEYLRLIAALANCSYDELVQRNRARRHKRAAGIAIGTVALVAVIALLGAVAVDHSREAKLAQSRELAVTSQQLYEDGDRYAAIQTALQALPESESSNRPYAPEARAALENALNLNYPTGTHWEPVYAITTKNPIGYVDGTMGHHTDSDHIGISVIATNDNSDFFAVSDDAGIITTYDVKTGKQLASWELTGAGAVTGSKSHVRTAVVYRRLLEMTDSNGVGQIVTFEGQTGKTVSEPGATAGKVSYYATSESCLADVSTTIGTDGFIVSTVDFYNKDHHTATFTDVGFSVLGYEMHCALVDDEETVFIGFGDMLFCADPVTEEIAKTLLAQPAATSVDWCGDTAVVCSASEISESAANYAETYRDYSVQAFDRDLNLLWSHDGSFAGDAFVNRDNDWGVYYPGEPRVCGATHDGRVLVTAGRDAYLLDLKTGEVSWSRSFEEVVVGAQTIPESDTTLLAITTADGNVMYKNPDPDALDPEGSGMRLECGFPVRWVKQYGNRDMVLVLRADVEDRIIAYRFVGEPSADPSDYSLDELIAMGHEVLADAGLE